ncbi:hypothetical protein [Paenibacillus sp. NPDC058177]|uniref:hypothetical protein n=1 Tax=Paenibacillus sp. NPDC058177 TaxID=3346369 RepID=UPI0036DB1525
MVIINFVDGTHLELNSDTVLRGYRRSDDNNGFERSFDLEDFISDEISIPKRVSSQIEVVNFILSSDCFTFRRGNDNDIFYFSASVKSVELANEQHVALPQIFGVPMNRN